MFSLFLQRSTWLEGKDTSENGGVPNILHVVRYGAAPMTFMVNKMIKLSHPFSFESSLFSPLFPGGSLHQGFLSAPETREVLPALKHC